VTLILTAPKPQKTAGMMPTGIIEPGSAPPLVSPHCWQCRLPVWTFEIDPISSIFYLGIEATCHGKTQGIKVPAEEAIKANVIWMFTGSR